MRPSDLGRINFVKPVFRGDIRGDVIVQPLQGVAHIAVLFDFPIQALNIVIHQIDIGLGGDAADLGVLFTVDDICFGCGVIGGFEQYMFDNILNLFHFRLRPQP